MFKSFINFLKSVVAPMSEYKSLDVYIVANNPQTPDDVDRLTRQFQMMRNGSMNFHE